MLVNKINSLLEFIQQRNVKHDIHKFLCKIPFFVLVFGILGIIVILGFITFSHNINNSLNITDDEHISGVASQEQAVLNTVIENTITSLVSITKTLVTLNYDQEAQLKFLQSLESSLSFDIIVMANVQGKALRSSGETIDISQNPVFQQAVKGDITATDVHVSNITGHYVFSIGVPIRRGGEIKGVVIAEYSTKYMTELLSSYTDSLESAFIVDSNGFTAAYASDIYHSLNFLRKAKFSNGMTYEQFLDYAKTRRWGGASFTLNGEERIIKFRPLDLNTWTLFLVSHDCQILFVIFLMKYNMLPVQCFAFSFC